jgi:hypothetical protein
MGRRGRSNNSGGGGEAICIAIIIIIIGLFLLGGAAAFTAQGKFLGLSVSVVGICSVPLLGL